MIYRCTKDLLKDLKITQGEELTIYNPLYSWHGKVMKIGRKKLVLLMNDATKFCLVLYGMTAKEFKNFNELVKDCLAQALKDAGFDEEIIQTYIQEDLSCHYMKTNTKRQVGILNSTAINLEFYFDMHQEGQILQNRLTLFLNKGIIKNNNGVYIDPIEEMMMSLENSHGSSEDKKPVTMVSDMNLGDLTNQKETEAKEDPQPQKRTEIKEELRSPHPGEDNQKCDKCVDKDVVVHVEGVGDYCLDCYNSIIAEIMGVEVVDDYARDLAIVDKKGKMHHFTISNHIDFMGHMWRAEEKGEGYIFEVVSEHDTNPRQSLAHLHRKILIGVGYKTLQLEKSKPFISNAIQHLGKQYTLHSVGTINLDYSTEHDEIRANIDGMYMDWTEVVKSFSKYEGFMMDYQIRDRSDEVLGENMILRQFDINPKNIYKRFEKRLYWFVEDNFLSSKKEIRFSEALNESLDELELVIKYGTRKEAELLGSEMVERLMSIETDADSVVDVMVENILGMLGEELAP